MIKKIHKFLNDNRGVTAAMGSVILMLLLLLSISTTLYFGSPTMRTLQELQAQKEATNQLTDIRFLSNTLLAPDSGFNTNFGMSSGSLGIEDGTEALITVMADTDYPLCNVHYSNWHNQSTDYYEMYIGDMCGDWQLRVDCDVINPEPFERCLEVYEIVNAAKIRKIITPYNIGTGNCETPGTAIPLNPSTPRTYLCFYDPITRNLDRLSEGETWLMEVTEGSDDNRRVQHSSAYISMQQLNWKHHSRDILVQAALEGNSIFNDRAESFFVMQRSEFQEKIYNDDQYYWELYNIQGPEYSVTAGEHIPVISVQLDSRQPLIELEDSKTIRFEFTDAWAESWCNYFFLRNEHLNKEDDGIYHKYPIDGGPPPGTVDRPENPSGENIIQLYNGSPDVDTHCSERSDNNREIYTTYYTQKDFQAFEFIFVYGELEVEVK